MPEIILVTETTVDAVCPNCSKPSFRICHEPGIYGPWGCDHCGARYKFDISENGIRVTPLPESNIPAWLVTKVTNTNPPVYFVTDSFIYTHSKDQTPGEKFKSTKFFPTNIVRIDAIVTDGSMDPHGVLEFVGQVEKLPEDTDVDYHETDWLTIIKRAELQNAQFSVGDNTIQ